MLIKQAFQNLFTNCITYSNDQMAEIKIDCSLEHTLKISISNHGENISDEEAIYLFDHFFRGKNSRDKVGFGLGLVLTKKIFDLNSGSITYATPFPNQNVFEIQFDLN